MIKTTTYLDLLDYAYNDSNLAKGDRVQRAIDGDPILQTEFNELVEVINVLDSVAPKVPDVCIEKILQFC